MLVSKIKLSIKRIRFNSYPERRYIIENDRIALKREKKRNMNLPSACFVHRDTKRKIITSVLEVSTAFPGLPRLMRQLQRP